MKNLHAGEARDKSRRSVERRHACRRTIKHAFGSEQWVKAIQTKYVLWPKLDRRVDERRCASRRIADRRAHHPYRNRTRRQRVLQRYTRHPVLTDEEKKMLNSLNEKH